MSEMVSDEESEVAIPPNVLLWLPRADRGSAEMRLFQGAHRHHDRPKEIRNLWTKRAASDSAQSWANVFVDVGFNGTPHLTGYAPRANVKSKSFRVERRK